MKAAKKITLCAVMAALAAVIMLVSHFMYLTYAVPAVAGLCIMVIVVEIDCKWAVLSYISASFLAFLFAETESMFLFVAFFGFYPIVKCLIEKLKKPLIEWVLKFLIFNAAIVSVYTVFSSLLMPTLEDMGRLAQYGEIILLVLANVVFVFYDIAVSRISWFYIEKFHSRVARLFK